MSEKSKFFNTICDIGDLSLICSAERLAGAFPEFASFIESEDVRLRAMAEFDLAAAFGTGRAIGADEAGRGPLAGPVTAACVRFSSFPFIPFLNDSKKMSEKERIFAERVIKGCGLCCFSVKSSSPSEIDRINILQASLKAMREAFFELPSEDGILLVDGNRLVPELSYPQKTVIKGDSKSFSIAAASVLAKTERDRIMLSLDSEFPGYGFSEHKGYPVKKHYEAIGRLGPSPVHRMTFLKSMFL